MIISRTPFRISFFGGGTDYPAWYREHGGAVLASSIDKYCHFTCRYLPPFFEHRIRVVYSKTENCQTVDEIKHPAFREVLRYLEIERGVEIHHDGDLPARSGMGSSSSFVVGLLHALYALLGKMPSKHQLAMESIRIEQDVIKEMVGSQDQVSAAHGGFNHIRFLDNGDITVAPVTIARERVEDLNAHLMLFYSGIKRTAARVAESYFEDVAAKQDRFRRIGEMVDESIEILRSGADISCFGELLDEAWQMKRSLSSKISNSHLDGIYGEAKAAGAVGGKVTGAGGGGFVLLFVPPDRQGTVSDRLNKFIQVPFKFEFSGSQIIFFGEEEDYSAAERVRAGQTIDEFRELAALRGARNETK